MRSIRNVMFALLCGTALLSVERPADADDLGCQGEDGYGETGLYGPVFCATEEPCCEVYFNEHGSDTIDAFCREWPGGPDYEASYFTAATNTQTTCDGIRIHCWCQEID
jgi:hypothetical protein